MSFKELLDSLALGEEQTTKIMASYKETIAKEFVPKHRFDEKNEEAKTSATALKERDEQLATLKESVKDVKGLEEKITALEETNKAQATTFKETQEKAAQANAIKEYLASQEDFTPNDAGIVLGLLDLSSITLGTDGKLGGSIADQVKSVKEEKPFLFKKVEKATPPVPPIIIDGYQGGNKSTGSEEPISIGQQLAAMKKKNLGIEEK